MYDSGIIKQQDSAKFVNLDVTDVKQLILVADQVQNKNDDCVDWADAKIYVESKQEADKEEYCRCRKKKQCLFRNPPPAFYCFPFIDPEHQKCHRIGCQ